MRVLVASQTVPSPPISGARIRLAHVVASLTALGHVDLFAMPDRPMPPQGPTGVRLEVAVRAPATTPWWRRLSWWARADCPPALAGAGRATVRGRFMAWAHPSYDLVWFHRAESYALLHDLAVGPTIVDLDDLEDRKILGRLAVAPVTLPGPGPLRAVRRALAEVAGRRDAHAWRRWQTRIAASVQAVAVCSEADRRHLGAPNASVIANGYDDADRPAGREAVADPPTILFAGFLAYPPNLDGAVWLLDEIAPRIWRRRPRVRFRLVGDAPEALRQRHDPPAVTVRGVASDMWPELATADLVVVPIRFGSGTRIKILEAFAHRLPVVATPAGAEGLEVTHERELLLAGDADAFADACLRALGDLPLRRRLADAGWHLYRTRYRWADIERTILALARRVASGGRCA
ncbi:MAG: glycosyltransferase [Armatimonadota bacterium]|nr:glycosyltransferase [Armatimonadota bacterium]